MTNKFFKNLFQSLTATLLVKIVGFVRELLILRFFGITAFVSSILALNFFPSLVSTFLRYYIPNMSLGLMGESNETEKNHLKMLLHL
jgi:peptidoglycan biosynthesis protein MviN/MurJ (putative lipid II flippase)